MEILRQRGFRLAIGGCALCIVSVIAEFLFLPKGPGIAGMLIGGTGVWTGFAWTLVDYYRSPRNRA
ncbi:MAG TPA: hypothetical protein VI759_05305 [Dehalococcoidia bacterium]|nr:hypothetical protein [Dehalococcoidia bacterium]